MKGYDTTREGKGKKVTIEGIKYVSDKSSSNCSSCAFQKDYLISESCYYVKCFDRVWKEVE